jgi:hypothetical protein
MEKVIRKTAERKSSLRGVLEDVTAQSPNRWSRVRDGVKECCGVRRMFNAFSSPTKE